MQREKNLKGLMIDEIASFVEEIGEQHYRANQIFYWLYNKGVSSFAEMTDVSKSLRAKLDEVACIEQIRLVRTQISRHDGTSKFLFELHDGSKIESVLIPAESADDSEGKRLTLCISTQVGCALDCKFCATGIMGYKRNLNASEIVDQLLQVQKQSQKRITNLVYMGMGEPLMNYDNVLKSVDIVTNERSIAISAKHITISTVGLADKIIQLADDRKKVKLAISLHSTDNALRTRLMPINTKFNLESLMAAVQYYYKKTKRRPTYEYILFDDLNDTDEDIKRFTRLARMVPCKTNIIPFHPIEFTKPTGFAARLRPSRHTEKFIEKLRRANLTVMVRSSAGEDIDAACGQLAVRS
jgi:23S rRNA (adenine2503-C2)-methyltransferase